MAAAPTSTGGEREPSAFAAGAVPHTNGAAGRAVGGVLLGGVLGGQQVEPVVGDQAGVIA